MTLMLPPGRSRWRKREMRPFTRLNSFCAVPLSSPARQHRRSALRLMACSNPDAQKAKGAARLLREHTWDHPVCRLTPSPLWVGSEAASLLCEGRRRQELLPCGGEAHPSEVRWQSAVRKGSPTAWALSAGDTGKGLRGLFSWAPRLLHLGWDSNTGGISA